jgi:hypothetical protein
MNWHCNSSVQNNKPSFNPIAAKMATESMENWKFLKFFQVPGAQLLLKWINHTEMRTGTVTLYYKAINQVSILQLQRRQKKKVQKPVNNHGQRHNIIRPVFWRAYKNQTRGPWATSLTWVILANISPLNTCKITFLFCH